MVGVVGVGTLVSSGVGGYFGKGIVGVFSGGG